MAFTQDEIQSINTILEAKLSLLRGEMQRAFDQRINTLKHEFEQHLAALQQELHDLPQRLDLQPQQFAERIEQTLDARLLAIEQLLRQHLIARSSDPASYDNAVAPGFEAIELQTEIPWEDLAEAVDKAVGARLTALNESLQATVRQMEHYLSLQLQSVRDTLASGAVQPYSGRLDNVEDAIAGIEHLERIMESMQVAMTTNHALLSNRLYHHQQLPPERAHPHSEDHTPLANGANNQLSQSTEQEDEQK
jgi:hypothetical protein